MYSVGNGFPHPGHCRTSLLELTLTPAYYGSKGSKRRAQENGRAPNPESTVEKAGAVFSK